MPFGQQNLCTFQLGIKLQTGSTLYEKTPLPLSRGAYILSRGAVCVRNVHVSAFLVRPGALGSPQRKISGTSIYNHEMKGDGKRVQQETAYSAVVVNDHNMYRTR